MNKFIIISLLLMLLAFPCLAQNKQSAQVQTQTQTANQGEEMQIQVQSNIQEQNSESNDDQNQEDEPDDDGDSAGEKAQNKDDKETGLANAVQRRSQVANAVQEMLQVADRNQGIGEQVREIAQAQNQNQEEIESGLEKIQNRNRFLRFFIGPDYKAIDEAQGLLKQSQEQIEQLAEIKNQLNNQSEASNLTEQIQVLEQAHNEINSALGQIANKFSLLGWLFKYLAR